MAEFTLETYSKTELPRMKELTKLMDARTIELPEPTSDESLVGVDEMKEFLNGLTPRQWLMFANLVALFQSDII